MKKTGRPVSPHVTIYAFPIAALSSIVNRATGMVLSVGCLGLGVIEMANGSGAALNLMETLGTSSFLIAGPAKFCVAFPFAYHYLGGVRHWVWDRNPDMLTNDDTEKSAYVLMGTSVVLGGIMMFV
jgi:succinate dehydrogenase (ubiquinone) cytochrome b560 subunit